MEPKDLIGRRTQFIELATKLFDEITNLPKEVRPLDDKPRTGIQIYLREAETRNSIFASIYQPSEQAQSFSVEKAVRSETLGDFSSQNSENPEKMKFRGSLSILFHRGMIQASCSGLSGDEDAAISLRLLKNLTGFSTEFIIGHIVRNEGMVPDCFFERGHYLYKLIYAD
ncbi:hypothetical protein HXX01_02265 [Candidatus Nomurabacteria bacterium]|nr:hypothetical protein [Candidatus Nomurabacteria bacterium]